MNGVQYHHNDEWSVGPCTHCTCKVGMMYLYMKRPSSNKRCLSSLTRWEMLFARRNTAKSQKIIPPRIYIPNRHFVIIITFYVYTGHSSLVPNL